MCMDVCKFSFLFPSFSFPFFIFLQKWQVVQFSSTPVPLKLKCSQGVRGASSSCELLQGSGCPDVQLRSAHSYGLRVGDLQ